MFFFYIIIYSFAISVPKSIFVSKNNNKNMYKLYKINYIKSLIYIFDLKNCEGIVKNVLMPKTYFSEKKKVFKPTKLGPL